MGETVSVELRIQNFEEFHKGLPQEEQICEAKRCMPFQLSLFLPDKKVSRMTYIF